MKMKPVTQANSILTELKSQTEYQHRQVESNINILSSDFTVEDYKDLLIRFYSFYKPYEGLLVSMLSVCSIGLDYAQRLKTPKLIADLLAVGLFNTDISKIDQSSELPNLDTPERVFGSLYVIEGSTLGGQVISRHLKEIFDLDAINGAAFFSGYQKETGKMWNEFRDEITSFAENKADRSEIINAANETFEKINFSLTGTYAR